MLYETIPFFHDIEKRLKDFYLVIDKDKKDRVRKVSSEIDFVRKRAGEMGTILRLGKEGKIPLRITHNDTKINNILFDCNDRALCVIDLDTVMPGYIHYDFGDAIRTTASRSAEDETDLDKVELDIKLFEAYSEGYLSEMANILTPDEAEYLAFSPRLITFTIGLRFLTDYLDGDNYFKIHRPDHNLERAKTQFKLVESNERQYITMKNIIGNIIERYK
jgi:Ser/Thr protein kinase RdoA (MazF antagonist)